jgi:hypothetical protein
VQANNLLKSVDRYGTMVEERRQERFLVDRVELEKEHSNLLERLHQLRRLLGYPPLLTGKVKRREIGE